MCKMGNNVKRMSFLNCNLFKRSFTNKGLGYTFNNEREDELIKKHARSTALFHNTDRKLSLMKSASSEHGLKVVLENNREEVERYMLNPLETDLEPTEITVALHNPKEPADIRSKSFNIPLGHSTTVYITAKAIEIDEDGMALTEPQRNCRLDEDTEALDVFNIYTRAACMFECKMKHSMKKCGCLPWNYPHNTMDKVSFNLHYKLLQ